MLGWFDALGWSLAPDRIVERSVDGDEPAAWREERGDGAGGGEIDYGRPEANDHERLARDRADVRSMTAGDLDAIARIDRVITGRDRRGYIAARLDEALDDASIRVSLAARCDGAVVGYLMARADLGDYGRTEPVAVLDTLGVDPDYAHLGIGQAMLSQLLADLGALRVERVETVVPRDDLGLLGFLQAAGFAPSQRLPFARACGAPARSDAG
jgi:ribosomal protein S18 acetylase RimI-like enzyme